MLVGTIHYKGYSGTIEKSDFGNYHGKLVDERNLVTYYQAHTFPELRKLFEETIDEFISFRKKREVK